MQTMEEIIAERDRRLSEIDERRRQAQADGRYEDVERLNRARQEVFLDAHKKPVAHPDYKKSLDVLGNLAKEGQTPASFKSLILAASKTNGMVALNATLLGKAAVLSVTKPDKPLPMPAPRKPANKRSPEKKLGSAGSPGAMP